MVQGLEEIELKPLGPRQEAIRLMDKFTTLWECWTIAGGKYRNGCRVPGWDEALGIFF